MESAPKPNDSDSTSPNVSEGVSTNPDHRDEMTSGQREKFDMREERLKEVRKEVKETGTKAGLRIVKPRDRDVIEKPKNMKESREFGDIGKREKVEAEVGNMKHAIAKRQSEISRNAEAQAAKSVDTTSEGVADAAEMVIKSVHDARKVSAKKRSLHNETTTFDVAPGIDGEEVQKIVASASSNFIVTPERGDSSDLAQEHVLQSGTENQDSVEIASDLPMPIIEGSNGGNERELKERRLGIEAKMNSPFSKYFLNGVRGQLEVVEQGDSTKLTRSVEAQKKAGVQDLLSKVERQLVRIGNDQISPRRLLAEVVASAETGHLDLIGQGKVIGDAIRVISQPATGAVGWRGLSESAKADTRVGELVSVISEYQRVRIPEFREHVSEEDVRRIEGAAEALRSSADIPEEYKDVFSGGDLNLGTPEELDDGKEGGPEQYPIKNDYEEKLAAHVAEVRKEPEVDESLEDESLEGEVYELEDYNVLPVDEGIDDEVLSESTKEYPVKSVEGEGVAEASDQLWRDLNDVESTSGLKRDAAGPRAVPQVENWLAMTEKDLQRVESQLDDNSYGRRQSSHEAYADQISQQLDGEGDFDIALGIEPGFQKWLVDRLGSKIAPGEPRYAEKLVSLIPKQIEYQRLEGKSGLLNRWRRYRLQRRSERSLRRWQKKYDQPGDSLMTMRGKLAEVMAALDARVTIGSEGDLDSVFATKEFLAQTARRLYRANISDRRRMDAAGNRGYEAVDRTVAKNATEVQDGVEFQTEDKKPWWVRGERHGERFKEVVYAESEDDARKLAESSGVTKLEIIERPKSFFARLMGRFSRSPRSKKRAAYQQRRNRGSMKEVDSFEPTDSQLLSSEEDFSTEEFPEKNKKAA